MIREQVLRISKLLFIGTLVIFSFGAAGEICGRFVETTAAAFGPDFPDNSAADIETVLELLGEPTNPPATPANSAGKPMALMLADGEPRSLVAWDLEGERKIWELGVPINSGLTTGGDLVLFRSGANMVAHNLTDGALAWDYRIDQGWDYRGATIDKDAGLALIALGIGGDQGGGYANGRVIALDTQKGKLRWTHTSGGGLLGEPAAHGGLIFVPWGQQVVTVLKTDGTEICRLRAGDFTINAVLADATGAYYSAPARDDAPPILFRFDATSVTGTREETTRFSPKLEPVPGKPHFKRDAFVKSFAGQSATEKIRFHAKAAVGEQPISFADNAYYLHYWRYIVAFNATTHQVLWSYRSADDVVSLQVVSGGLTGATAEGRLFFLDGATGTETWNVQTGSKILTAAFDSDGFAKPALADAQTDVLTGLKEMIWDKDNRMLPIRTYAAYLMAAIPEPEVTRDLLEVYSSADIPKSLRDTVVDALSKRTTGSKYLVQALNMRYDYLELTQAPPMNVVARALVNMNDRSAVPGLLDHLMNHETKTEYLYDIAAAIGQLGDPSVIGILRHFLTLYHADSSMVGNEHALAEVAASIVKFDPQYGPKYLEQLRAERQTLTDLKPLLTKILTAKDDTTDAAAQAAADADATARAQAAEQARLKAAEEAAARSRKTVSRGQIRKVFTSNSTLFNKCVQVALRQRPELKSLRLNFTITGNTGKASRLTLLPTNIEGLDKCMENSLAKVTFPRFTNLKQKASHTIMIENLSMAEPFVAEVETVEEDTDEKKAYDPDSFESQKTKPVRKTKGYDPDAF